MSISAALLPSETPNFKLSAQIRAGETESLKYFYCEIKNRNDQKINYLEKLNHYLET